MLVTATNELRFNPWPEDGTDEVYNLSITSEITSLSWSKDNNFIIYLQQGGRPEILNLKDISNIKPIHIITAIDNANVVMFQRKTKRCVAIGTASSTVALYDTKTKSIGKLFTLTDGVVGLDFNSQDEFLVVACKDGIISLLNVKDGTEACSYNAGGTPSTIKFHQTNPDLFAIGTNEGTLFVYDINEPNPLYLGKSHCGRINDLCFISKHDTLVSAGEDNKFCVHDYTQQMCVFMGYLQYPLSCADVTPDGRYLAIGTTDGTIIVYETKNYLTHLVAWKPHACKIQFLKFSNKFESDSDGNNTSIASTNRTNVIAKVQQENDFKSLYNKFLNKAEDEDTLKLLKDDIISDIKKDATQLHAQMNLHMSNLQHFIKKEFEKMTLQMDDKWDILNMVSGNYKTNDETASDAMLYDIENPVVLE